MRNVWFIRCYYSINPRSNCIYGIDKYNTNINLLVKRYIEKPRRPWKIWWFDASKQVISACVVHLLNLLLSIFLSNSEQSDECVWYFITILMDCTLGVFISYIFMWMIGGIAKVSGWKMLNTGLYYEEYIKNGKKKYRLIPKMYFSQLGVWLVVTVLNKLILLAILKICVQFLENLGNFVLNPFSNGKVKLVMVMIIFPVILNAIYFWITDSILKFNPEEGDRDMNEFYAQEDKNEGENVTKGKNSDSNINNNSNNGNKVAQESEEFNQNELIRNNMKEDNEMENNEVEIKDGIGENIYNKNDLIEEKENKLF